MNAETSARRRAPRTVPQSLVPRRMGVSAMAVSMTAASGLRAACCSTVSSLGMVVS